jgi:hypothetical protein
MDRVKFGRALGYGARHAAKTLAQAVDAASAPNPSASRPSSPQQPQARVIETRASAGPRRIPDVQTVSAAGRQVKSSLVTPVVRFSSVVWLQVTGVFFGLVAFTMGTAAWRAWAAFHSGADSHSAIKVYAYVAVCVLFTYFALSSFARAARR